MQIQAHPHKTISWEEFKTTHPHHSIALDGYVEGKPEHDRKTLHANFNHHEDVNRLATRCTAAQVFMAIKQGLLTPFTPEDIILWVNDCDQDVCMAVWLFHNWERLIGTKSEPLISRLVHNVDMLDTCAGAYSIEPQSRIMKDMCWIFEPYTSARISGRVTGFSGSEMTMLIEAVGHRITEYTLGMGKQLNPDARYEVLGGDENWKLVKEIGNEARTAMRRDGIQTFISYRGTTPTGGSIYSIGNLVPFGGFDLLDIYKKANALEGIEATNPNRWGGSDSCGGSPREGGSSITPEKIGDILK